MTQDLTPIATDLTYDVDIQFGTVPGIWVSTPATVIEALAIIKTGLFRNQSVSRIKLFAITQESESVSFVYDIDAAGQGNSPWSLLSESI